MSTIDSFVNNFDIGARANMYKVFIDGLDQKLEFTCKAAQLPGRTINPIEVKYLANTIKLGGDSIFDDWTVTILADEDFGVRNAIIEWQEQIKAAKDATGQSTLNYMRTAEIVHLKRDGGENSDARFKFFNLWPTVLDPVELSFDSADTIAEYGCTFSVGYWEKL